MGLIITRAHRPLNPGQQLRKRAMLSASIDLSCGCRAFGSAGQNSQNRPRAKGPLETLSVKSGR